MDHSSIQCRSSMNVLVQGAVHALGYYEDGKYSREPDCYESIRDLIRYLREDGDDHTARIECGRHNLVEQDLVPMVKCEDLTDDEFDIAIRLMVNLCQPAISTMRGKPPADRDQWKMYWELEENLRRAKTAFSDAHFFTAIKKRIDNYFIDTEYEDRDERLRLVVERIVLLIKYVFSINPDTSEGRRTRIEDSSHDRVIIAFLESGIDKTLMHIANQPREKEFHVTILDIFALILKEQTAEDLATKSEEVSTAEQKKTEEEFRKIIENHVVKETQKRKSFSRFGGSYTIKGLKGISANSSQVVFKPIQNVEKHNFLDDRKAKKRAPRNRRPFEIDTNSHFASSEVRGMLRDMVIRIIETCFNRLMKSSKTTVFVQVQKTSQINYFFLIKFVLRFVRLSRQDHLLERISECIGVEAFHENNVQLTEYVENATTLKGVEAKSHGLKAQYALGAYNELVLLHRYIYEHAKEENERKFAKRALEHIVNVEEYRELPIFIIKKFSSSVLSNNFLRELVLTTHHYMKLVERFVKTGALKKVTKKVKVRKATKKSKMSEEDVRSEFDGMSKKDLDRLWEESKGLVLQILKKEVPEMRGMNPIDSQLDVPVDAQQKFAKLSIQRSLRSRGFPAAVGLYHASRALWPESFKRGLTDFQDSPGEEDQLQELEQLLKADMKKVAKDLKKAESCKTCDEDPAYKKYDKMDATALQSLWEQSTDTLARILSHELPESESTSPVNWQLDITPDVQQKFAMLAIQRALRARDLPAAVGLYHTSRKLWPGDEAIFGAPGIGVEEEIAELKAILEADLHEVAREMKVAEDRAEDPDEEDPAEPYDSEQEEEEEVPAWKVEEIDFQFDSYVCKFSNVDVLKWYVFLLNDFSKNSTELNQALVKMLHRIAFDLKLPIKLYQVSLFQVFSKVNEHFTHLSKDLRKSSRLYELYQFGFHLLKKFFSKFTGDLAIEALFWKGPRECFEIENGYGSWVKSREADIRVWTEDLEIELRNLYEEYRTMETRDGIDVLDFIEHNLSRARSRKKVAKKLIEFGFDLLGAKWKNSDKARMDSVLPIGDIQKWYDEWKEAGARGDLVNVLQEKLNEDLGMEISRKKILKQLAHMDILYEKPKKEKPLPQWDTGLIEELKKLKEQYDDIPDALNMLGVNIVRYVMKRLSEKKPTRQVERHLESLGATIPERSKKSEKNGKKFDDFLNDDDDDSENDVGGGSEDDEEEEIVMKSKRIIPDSEDEEEHIEQEEAQKKLEKVAEKPNTLMGMIAGRKRKLAQLESDSSDESDDDDSAEKEEKKLPAAEDDSDLEEDAVIYKRSYVDALLTGGSIAGNGITETRRDTSEEREDDDDEDPFTKKLTFKRRIVMSDNEDEA